MFGSDEKCQVMTAHVALLMQAAQNFANDLPLVVAGDFNILPGSTSSRLHSLFIQKKIRSFLFF
jgi:endonuclease/exonuclease/phosphatase family metal-dependent hydrolase